MKRLLVFLGLMVLLLTGCSAISQGYITEKNYTPGYTSYQSQCVMYRKDMSCQMYQQVPYHVPDSWSFSIKKGKDKGWVEVNKGIYDNYKIGDYYPRSSNG